MTATVPAPVLRELARTEGGPRALDHLVHDQATRRLLLLRALLDAVQEAPAGRLAPGARQRVAEDWALLETAEAAGPGARERVRALLLRPLTGPLARHALAALTGPRADGGAGLTEALDHFSTLAAAAAISAGVPFTARLTAYEGLLALPSFGALRTEGTAPRGVTAAFTGSALTLDPEGGSPVTVFPQPSYGAWSADAAWLPAYALPPLTPGAQVVPLDDVSPYRQVPGPAHSSLSRPVTLDDQSRKRWYEAWSGTAGLLALGGAHRTGEAVRLLRSVVPLRTPPGASTEGHPSGSCSGTRKEAFGVVLASVPPSPAGFAALLVHELQHAKLAALGELTPLHHASAAAVHFAPWRPDPRPFDGLLQGIYSHLALAGWWQCYALAAEEGPERDHAWSEHARCREQVGAALPALVGSEDLTEQGRVLADGMVSAYLHLSRVEPPAGHLARARAYVDTARALWQQRRTRG
ncbi:aKG-HExxH-type peptide beta-hydroxylase [Streptomyces sp. NPDC007088]|uniref:aKG-HExxH-type peptide beta-hydroxylase n=1 Tax=Streptomyces sp. NPDC007088 TaxID=3364773 RepID=UPI0036904CD0